MVGNAIKGVGSLDQEKLTAYIHANSFHTILCDVSFCDDGVRKEAKILYEQFHDVRCNDINQSGVVRRKPSSSRYPMRPGTLIVPYSDIVH